MPGVLDKKYVYIDYEFSDSNQRQLRLTSCSWRIDDGKDRHIWLYGMKENQCKLAAHLEKYKDTHIFVAYAATAEARSMQALGLEPRDYKWVDLFFEQRQLTHSYYPCKYGRYVTKTGMWRQSVPPSYNPLKNIGKDNNAIGVSYVAAASNHLGKYVDSVRKREMRDLILSQLDDYSLEQQNDIMTYGDDDIQHLPALHKVMTERLCEAVEGSQEEVLEFQLSRGRYAANLAHMEAEGFPVRVDWVKNLRRNFETAKDVIISELVDTHFPFYIKQKKRKRDLQGNWTMKYDKFREFINNCADIPHHPDPDKVIDLYDLEPGSVIKQWPLSEKTGKYRTDEKTLEKYDGIPALYAFRQANKLIGQLKWFQKPKKDDDVDFLDNVGDDNRLRAFLGAYGTQTGRNAPRAKTFVLAMSAWLRCLIQPEEGKSIVAIDYASQEFVIAAILSGDKNMIEAYRSGDPYLYFAKKAGAVPEDGTKADYADERNLFKATTLGLQYGMGAENLAIKLTADCGRFVSLREAEKLIELHKKTYPTYWRWLDRDISRVYKRNGYLMLFDGWSLLPNQDNDLSVKNFPVQGTAAVIMRIAIDLYIERGGHPLAPLHDAIYAIFDDKTEQHHPELLGKCMQEAVEIVLGAVEIRQDRDIHGHDEVWIEPKGEKYYKLLKQYLDHMPTEEDKVTRLHETVFRREACFN